MEKVFDLHQHTHCVIIHIGKEDISAYISSTSNRIFTCSEAYLTNLRAIIAYNKQKTDVTFVGWNFKKIEKDDIVIYGFRDGLYDLFKKDKETWNEDDYFLLKAVSDYLSLAIKETMKRQKLKIGNFNLFHYAFVVPSEWEEEMRDDIIRPIFVQSGLISKEDHQDRLLFVTDIEAICYNYSFERGQNTILCRITPEEEELIIKFDLIQTATTLFNFPNAQLFPKVMKSSSVSITNNYVQGCIKYFLRENLFPVDSVDNDGIRESLNSELVPFDENQIIKAVMDGVNDWRFFALEGEGEKEEEPWITFKKEWMLSDSQKEFINSLCPSVIFAEVGIFLLDYMKDIISNKFTNSYGFLLCEDNSSGWYEKWGDEIIWLNHILEYNRRSLNSVVTIATLGPCVIDPERIFSGAGIAVFDAIKHSDLYCKPRIVSSADSTISSSVFLNSKPNAIVNLDISLRSTLFTCSILDEDGSIQGIFDHGYFIQDKHLPPLGYFLTISDRATLNIKEQFIPFAERYLLGDLSDLIAGDSDSIKEDLLLQMKAILTNILSNGEVLVSTDEQKYIKAFTLMYMIYIKEDILYKLPDTLASDQIDIKIGFAISIESMILDKIVENKDNLRDIIYASGLVPKDDHSKKLRITTQGERVLPAIQKFFKLELPLKSYFLLCQLHEDYVQLSLHQVVTEPSLEEKEQESIIVQDEILPIRNIYDSLCSTIWYSLLKDSSLIEFCKIHNTSNDNTIFNIFSSQIKTEFFVNLKDHISYNVLQNNSSTKTTSAVNLNSSCDCKVHLTTSDIIDISFTPVLQDISCDLSASLLNKELFGNYVNIDYLFSFIRFNNNPQLQRTFARILEEEASDFNLELGIDTSCLAVPELFSQSLQPVVAQQPFCYKDFKIGALQQVCRENYAFSIGQGLIGDPYLIYKSKITDAKTIECNSKIAFPFLNKGEAINNVRSNRKFYLRTRNDYVFDRIVMELYRFETMNYLENNETLSGYDNIYQNVGDTSIYFDNVFNEKDIDVPVMVSISYVPYTSSLRFFMKIAGVDTKDGYLTGGFDIGEPLTLARF